MSATMLATNQSPRERELRGRGNERLELPMHNDSSDGPKLCECGCGQAAPIATKTYARVGHVAGQPMRFVRGHNGRNVPMKEHLRHELAVRWRGASNPRYAGGTHRDARGYTVMVLPDEHRFASMRDARGRVYRHRLVIAEYLGRALTEEEEVHHLDEDKSNDAVANLLVVSSFEHKRIHALVKHGADLFDAAARVVAERTR